jgi:hypothetical protein
MTGSTDGEELRLSVVHGGEPTPDELAALVVALSRRTASADAPTTKSRWGDRTAALLRSRHVPWR